jgi:hypothetical protein
MRAEKSWRSDTRMTPGKKKGLPSSWQAFVFIVGRLGFEPMTKE